MVQNQSSLIAKYLASELTDAAIRNYELGYSVPNKDQLIKIVEALTCDLSALIDHTPISNFEFMQIIFDYEELLKLRPLIKEGIEALICHDINFNDFLKEWDEMRKKHYNGEITDDEFRDWKLSYPKKSRFKK